MDPASLQKKLADREREHRLRRLQPVPVGVDFFSNDYLGITRNTLLERATAGALPAHGSTGSRLLGGNFPEGLQTEEAIAAFHNSPAALLFTSGYDANLGLLSCIAGRGDTIIYDQLAHASLRDGVRLSPATSFSFAHNDVDDLDRLLQKATGNCYVVTESVFSMDGDSAPLSGIADRCSRYGAFLIVDEAHATGIAGPNGAGLVQKFSLESRCFARIHTFGKALGCHGAVILGSEQLKDYLVNFCRTLIYTTALPPVAVQAIRNTYQIFPAMEKERAHLQTLISRFSYLKSTLPAAGISAVPAMPAPPESPIQAVIIPGNSRVSAAADYLREKGLAVYPVFSPTVKTGMERLRIILHAYNSCEEVDWLVEGIAEVLR